jgi:hypothetical protein
MLIMVGGSGVAVSDSRYPQWRNQAVALRGATAAIAVATAFSSKSTARVLAARKP